MEESNKKHFPLEIMELEPEEREELRRLKAPDIDLISVGPKKYKLLRTYLQDAANIYNMPVRSSDIFIVTFQRSGTTWTQELVWLLENDLDYEAAAATPLSLRYAFLEKFMFFGEKWQKNILETEKDKEKALQIINKISTPVSGQLLSMPSPRFIKSHLPMSFLPPTLLDTAKVVYVARDPRDVAVSWYYFCKDFKGYEYLTTFKDVWQIFIKDLAILTPYFEAVKEAWELRNNPNMLFLFYEELSKDLPASVQRVADFLGKKITPEQMKILCDHLSIENFRNNESVNSSIQKKGHLVKFTNYIRKGKVGGWRDHFDEEMTQQAECWIADNLRDTDLRFPQV